MNETVPTTDAAADTPGGTPDTPRAAVHLSPFVGAVTAEWNEQIEQVVVKVGNGGDASLHVDPTSARRLARSLIGAADEAVGPLAARTERPHILACDIDKLPEGGGTR